MVMRDARCATHEAQCTDLANVGLHRVGLCLELLLACLGAVVGQQVGHLPVQRLGLALLRLEVAALVLQVLQEGACKFVCVRLLA